MVLQSHRDGRSNTPNSGNEENIGWQYIKKCVSNAKGHLDILPTNKQCNKILKRLKVVMSNLSGSAPWVAHSMQGEPRHNIMK